MKPGASPGPRFRSKLRGIYRERLKAYYYNTVKRQKLEQEDYIKRQIHQLGIALGVILADLIRLTARGREIQEIEAADQAIKTALGLNIEDLTLIPTKSFLTTLLDTQKFSDNNFEQLAEIMFLIAEELNAGKTEVGKMKKLYERALIIFTILDKTSLTYSFDRHAKIEKIKNVL
jgi:hypothetical protein